MLILTGGVGGGIFLHSNENFLAIELDGGEGKWSENFQVQKISQGKTFPRLQRKDADDSAEEAVGTVGGVLDAAYNQLLGLSSVITLVISNIVHVLGGPLS